MTWAKKELESTLRLAHLDLHNAQKKLREVMAVVSSLPLPDDAGEFPACPQCGVLRSVTSEEKLAEHMENVHGEWRAA